MSDDQIPGWGGSQGPFEDEYTKPHIYARDVHSGAGNCVCGAGLGEKVHFQAAPGVDVPEHMRQGVFDYLAVKPPNIKKLWDQNPNDNIDNPTTIPNQMQPQKKQPVVNPSTDADPLDMASGSTPGATKNSYLNVFGGDMPEWLEQKIFGGDEKQDEE